MMNGTGDRPQMPQWEYQDDVILSGIAGYFPQSNGLEEFQEKLYAGVDMVCSLDEKYAYWKSLCSVVVSHN